MHGTQITYAVLPGALTVCEQKCVCVWGCVREREGEREKKSLAPSRIQTQDVLIMKLWYSPPLLQLAKIFFFG